MKNGILSRSDIVEMVAILFQTLWVEMECYL